MTVLDYIEKFGDKCFDEVAFNDVDNVIFSALSYIDFDSIVSYNAKNKITIQKAYEKFIEVDQYYQMKRTMLIYKTALKIIKKIAYTKRYGSLLLYNYSYITSNEHQFSALTIEINEQLIYVSYEGTDHLLSGWKEDFKMSYIFPVPAQKYAIQYINRYSFKNKKIILGGHSKGGNLALVAGMYANFFVKKKIIKIYSNDGPGLRKAQITSEKYKAVLDKLVSIIPNYSLVGLLLRHTRNQKIVLSDKKGVLAHDLIHWQVEETDFIPSELSTFSKILDKSMLEWVNKYSDYQRKVFTESLFSVFERANVNNLIDVMNNKKIILKLIYETRNIDKVTRKMLRDFIWVIFEYAKDSKKI